MATNQFDIQASGGDFTTLALWEDDRDTNGTTSTDIEIAVLNAAESFAGCTLSGWTTRTGGAYIEVTAAAAYQHNGDVNSSTGGGQACLTSQVVGLDSFIRLTDLFSLNSSDGGFLHGGGTTDNKITRCITNGSIGDAFSQFSASTITQNCIAINSKNGFITALADSGKLFHCLAYNNTFFGFGVATPGTHYYTQIRNCIALGSGTSDFDTGDHASSDVDYVVYNDKEPDSTIGANSVSGASATASASPGAGTWVGFTNITPGSEDFELITMDVTNQALASAVTGTGVTDDILERARDGSTPDIGPFEQPSAGVTEAALSLAVTAGVTFASLALSEAAAALDATAGVAFAVTATGEAAVAMAASAGVSFAALATVEGVAAYDAALGLILNGGAAVDTTLTFDASAAIDTTGGISIECALALAITGGYANGAQVTAEVTLPFDAGASIAAGATSVAEAALNLATVQAMQIIAQAVTEAGLSLDAIGGITTDGEIVLISVGVSPGRTITVSVEIRTIFVKDDGQ